MSIVSPTKEECPACGAKVGASVYGQISPHSGRNGCTYSGNAHQFRSDFDPSEYYEGDDSE